MPSENGAPRQPTTTTQPDQSSEHLTVLDDALRDDDEDYEDPPLASLRPRWPTSFAKSRTISDIDRT